MNLVTQLIPIVKIPQNVEIRDLAIFKKVKMSVREMITLFRKPLTGLKRLRIFS